MSISTKTGDKGETSLIGGERVKKNDIRIEAYGTIDELNAVIGIALNHVDSQAIAGVLTQVQHDLFTLGSELAALTGKEINMDLPRVHDEHLTFLDESVRAVEDALPKQTSFILPNGTLSAAHLHHARTVCRRAERRVLAIKEHEPSEHIVKYLNRLSDVLFLFARAENKQKEVPVDYGDRTDEAPQC